MKYSLRSLMVATFIGPPVLALAIRVMWLPSDFDPLISLGKCLVCLFAAVVVGFMVSIWIDFFGKMLTQ
jgi:hypothetical protein